MLDRVVKLNFMAGAVLPSQVFGSEMVKNERRRHQHFLDERFQAADPHTGYRQRLR